MSGWTVGSTGGVGTSIDGAEIGPPVTAGNWPVVAWLNSAEYDGGRTDDVGAGAGVGSDDRPLEGDAAGDVVASPLSLDSGA